MCHMNNTGTQPEVIRAIMLDGSPCVVHGMHVCAATPASPSTLPAKKDAVRPTRDRPARLARPGAPSTTGRARFGRHSAPDGAGSNARRHVGTCTQLTQLPGHPLSHSG